MGTQNLFQNHMKFANQRGHMTFLLFSKLRYLKGNSSEDVDAQ